MRNLAMQSAKKLCHTLHLGENIMVNGQVSQICRNHKLCLQLAERALGHT